MLQSIRLVGDVANSLTDNCVVSSKANERVRDLLQRSLMVAAKYGAEIDLDNLLDRMSQDCPWRDDRKPLWKSACGIKFTGLPPMRPPDLPPRPLRVLQGGKW